MEMTASYTEIEDAAVRPTSLAQMTHFVADDLEYRIKISSPASKPSGERRRRVDATVLDELEAEAKKIAHSVDALIENLAAVLHSISSITADNVDAYRDAVAKTCDSIDSNIKCMYTILAKGEEVFDAMAPVRSYAARIAEIRRLLNLFESNA